MAKNETILLGGREVLRESIRAYVIHLRRSRNADVRSFDEERARLHNAIFLAAGLKDGQFAKARTIGYGADRDDPEERPYWEFNDALDDLLCTVLACPDCHTTLKYDMTCMQPGCKHYGKRVSTLDHLNVLSKIDRIADGKVYWKEN